MAVRIRKTNELPPYLTKELLLTNEDTRRKSVSRYGSKKVAQRMGDNEPLPKLTADDWAALEKMCTPTLHKENAVVDGVTDDGECYDVCSLAPPTHITPERRAEIEEAERFGKILEPEDGSAEFFPAR